MSKNRDRSYTDGNKRCYVCKSCGLCIYEDLPIWQKKKTKQKNICSKCLGERKVAKETREERSMFSAYSAYRMCDHNKITLFNQGRRKI